MGESIDKQTVIDLIQALTFSRCMEYGEYPVEDVGKEHLVRSDILINAIKELQPAEPKIGHWIGIGDEPCEDFECDHCSCVYETNGIYDLPIYCPKCGSKMEKVDKNN